MHKYFFKTVIIVFTLIFLLSGFSLDLLPVNAQSSAGIIWSPQVNLSRSPDKTSTDPFLVADPTGFVHLFWAEKVTDAPGNVPDTLMYTVWDGKNWSKVIDIHFSPASHGNAIVNYPHAVIDHQQNLHLVWLAQPNFPNYALFYSTAPSSDSQSSASWSEPVVIADDLTGTNYGVDIKYDPETGFLHAVYARVPGGDTPPELRAATYIRSTDGGRSWSAPIDIFTASTPDSGASNTRLLIGGSNRIYASWSQWDYSGNGQAIYFSRSLDSGLTWQNPVQLTRKVGAEYERDWNLLGLLPDGNIVSFWEGGFRAYRQAQYSTDDGVTWSEPVDTFPTLIGENGFAVIAKDSLDRVHFFNAQRVREGSDMETETEGLWHSVWEGGRRWSIPVLAPGSNTMLNPSVVILGGNQVVAAWLTNPEYEIRAMTGVIPDAPATPYVAAALPTPEDPVLVETATATPITIPGTNQSNGPLPADLTELPGSTPDPATGVTLSIFASTAIIGVIMAIKKPWKK